MHGKSLVNFIVGAAGSGKTYREVYYIINSYIPSLGENEYLYCNLPLNVDEIVKYFKEETDYSYSKNLKDRIVIISEDEISLWKESKTANWKAQRKKQGLDEKPFGAWSYLQDKPTQGCILIIDEIQKICGKTDTKAYREEWTNFLSTARKWGFKFIDFISQNEMTISTEIKYQAGQKVTLINKRNLKDKVFNIRWECWYNLFAGFTGKFTQVVIEEVRHIGDIQSMKAIERREIIIRGKYFKFYNSYHVDEKDKRDGDKGKEVQNRNKEPYEKYSKIGLVFWFLIGNTQQLGTRFLIALSFIIILIPAFRNAIIERIFDVDLSNDTYQEQPQNGINTETVSKTDNQNNINATPNIDTPKNEVDKNQVDKKEPLRISSSRDIGDFEQIKIIGSNYCFTNKNRLLFVGDEMNGKKIKEIRHFERVVIFYE